MPDGYVTGSGGMSYCNQTLFLFRRVGSGHETTHAHALIIHHRKIFVHLIFAAKATGGKIFSGKNFQFTVYTFRTIYTIYGTWCSGVVWRLPRELSTCVNSVYQALSLQSHSWVFTAILEKMQILILPPYLHKYLRQQRRTRLADLCQCASTLSCVPMSCDIG